MTPSLITDTEEPTAFASHILFAHQPSGQAIVRRLLHHRPNNLRMTEKREWDPLWLAKALEDPKRPTFLMGCTPPREGTTRDQACKSLRSFEP